MTYNDTFFDNATSLTQVAQGTNTAADGWLFTLILLFLGLFIFIIGIRIYDTRQVLLADAFILTLASVPLYALQLISGVTLSVIVISLAATIMLKIWGD